MATGDQDAVDRSNDALDELVGTARGHQSDRSLADTRNPALVETVRRLRALDDAGRPDPDLTNRIWENLMSQTLSAAALPYPHSRGAMPMSNGRMPAPALWAPARWSAGSHRGGTVHRFVLAALLVLSLVAGYAWFGPGRQGDGGPAHIPAAVVQVASPSPTGVLDQGTLVEVTLPADMLPLQETTEVGLVIEVAPAGSTTVVTGVPGGCCTSLSVSYVLEGTSTFRAEEPAYVLRADGDAPPELVAPGTEVSLAPGDAIVYRDAGGWEWAVTGDGPLRLLSLWITEGATLPSPELADWGREDSEIVQTDPLPAEPLTLRLGQVTVDAGATLSPGPAVVQVAVALPDEDARLAVQGDYGVRNAGTEPVALYVASLSPAGPDAEVVIAGMQAPPPAATPAP